MNLQERKQRVTQLSSNWFDGVATPDELEELNELLKGDPDACEWYLDLAESHAELLQHSADIPSLIPFPSSRPSVPKPRKGFVAALAIAAIVAMLINAAVLWKSPQDAVGPTEAMAENGVAVLSRVVAPEWTESSGTFREGSTLPAGPFSLRSGLAQIEFFSGATVIVEGPAELDLESAWKITCRSGKLRAFVPDPAKGFAIDTPDYRAVDLGTEFALSVGKDGQSEVHVVDGEIRLDDRDGNELRHMLKGDGLRSESAGEFTAVDSAGEQFIGREQLLSLAENDWQSRHRAWAGMIRSRSADTSTVVLFDFENQNAWDRHLNNLSGKAGAAVIGAQWTQGRWPGKSALEFKRITDRVRLNVPGEFDAVTLSAWVRIESFDRWLSSLLLTDNFDSGEMHWQISDSGELILGVKDAEPLNSFSPPLISPSDLGNWMHLAVTADTEKRIVTHYLNGSPVSSHEITFGGKIRIGAAEIGNWRSESQSHPIRSLNGRIDEFAIISRALDADEIRSLYENGRPNG